MRPEDFLAQQRGSPPSSRAGSEEEQLDVVGAIRKETHHFRMLRCHGENGVEKKGFGGSGKDCEDDVQDQGMMPWKWRVERH